MKSKILIVDDEKIVRETLKEAFMEQGYDVREASSGKEGVKEFNRFEPDLVILDLVLGDSDGIEILKEMKNSDSEVHVIIITAYGDIEEAVEAGKFGASDFVKKPYELEEMLSRVRSTLDTRSLKRRLHYMEGKEKREFEEGKIMGESPQIREVLETAKKISQTELPSTVLITGESGTGKQMLARALHYGSSRSTQPFIECNCSAIPETLIESELFGCEKGAYTDAKERRAGLVELADRGTLFLDEIGDMALPLQAKMLKFIEEKKFRRLGSTKLIEVDTRFIVATNKDLRQLIEEEKFRADLYYRLNVVSLALPPLRERENDLLLLAEHFLKRYNKVFGKDFQGISESVKEVFLEYSWPGNIRELKNFMERVVLLEKGPEITIEHLPQEMIGGVLVGNILDKSEPKRQIYSLEELEAVYVQRVLQFCQSNKTKAAKLLGIDRHTLDKKLKKH
ncbi:MAG TPA: sigma-54 dependent transcriptional regulator [Nitrospinota bacterium]|nr:sigma-54 dependent transcriptional regulator [Nitrospinota bacterium]